MKATIIFSTVLTGLALASPRFTAESNTSVGKRAESVNQGLGDLAGALGHLLQGAQKGVSINNAEDYIPDLQALLGAAPGILNGLESLTGKPSGQPS